MKTSPDPDSWSWRNSPLLPGPAVIVDMDGVISDAAGRQHFLNEPPKNYKGFFAACGQDPPLQATSTLLRNLRSDLLVILLTARPSWVRQETLEWLERHDMRWDLLILRAKKQDSMLAGQFKLQSLNELQNRGFELLVGLDDDPKNVEIFENFGMPCIYVYSGYYTDPPHPTSRVASNTASNAATTHPDPNKGRALS